MWLAQLRDLNEMRIYVWKTKANKVGEKESIFRAAIAEKDAKIAELEATNKKLVQEASGEGKSYCHNAMKCFAL